MSAHRSRLAPHPRRSSGPAVCARGPPAGLALRGSTPAALLLLLGLGMLGFGPVFGGDPYYLYAGFGGILLGLALAALSARLRLAC